MTEYTSILFIRLLFFVTFLGSYVYSFLFYINVFSFLFVWVRCVPRFHYDNLIYLAWRRFLPLSFNYFLFFVGVLFFSNIIFFTVLDLHGHSDPKTRILVNFITPE
jgi:NADH:ubiquinone oxidoreductase subunit H